VVRSEEGKEDRMSVREGGYLRRERELEEEERLSTGS